MQLNLDPTTQGNLIHGFRVTDGGLEIRIGSAIHNQSIIITAEQVVPWHVIHFDDLRTEHFVDLARIDTEVLLLGTGHHMQFPAPILTRPLVDRQIGVEIMDTAAACRTYNILRGDGRSVAAALILESKTD